MSGFEESVTLRIVTAKIRRKCKKERFRLPIGAGDCVEVEWESSENNLFGKIR